MKKLRKSSTALAVGALLAGAGAITLAGAGPAGAATVPVSKDFTYSCNLPILGATPFDVTVSADVPDSVVAGQPIHLDNFQTSVVTPANVTSLLVAFGVAFVEGDPQATPPGGALVTNEITDNGVLHESTFQAAVPKTAVPTDGSALTTVATATVPDYTTTAAGSVVLGSGPFTVTLHGTKADGSDAGVDSLLTFTCDPPSDATLATVAVVDTASLTMTGPSSVRAGSTATLSTVLTDTITGQPISGAPVVLQRRASSTAPWSDVATVTTSSTGAASSGLALTANTQFRWSYAGDATHQAATSPTKSVSAVPDTTSSTISGPSSAKYGASAKFSTVLRDTTTGKALGGVHSVLQRRANSSKAWATVATVTTSSTGAASKTLTLTANDQYRWSYAGDTTHKASTSAVKSVPVAQVIAIHSTRKHVRHRVAFKIWGAVKPAGSGQKVTLQQLVGRAWRNTATATLKRQKMPNGSTTVGYVFTVKLVRLGTHRLRVHKAATPTLGQATSSAVAVRVT